MTSTTDGSHAKSARAKATTSVETHANEAARKDTAIEATTRDLSTTTRDSTGHLNEERVQKATLGETMMDNDGYVREMRPQEIRIIATKTNERIPRSNPATSGTVAGVEVEDTAINVETTEVTVSTGENGGPKSTGAAAVVERRRRRSKARRLVRKVLHPSQATKK
jgi:hypothetical protein